MEISSLHPRRHLPISSQFCGADHFRRRLYPRCRQSGMSFLPGGTGQRRTCNRLATPHYEHGAIVHHDQAGRRTAWVRVCLTALIFSFDFFTTMLLVGGVVSCVGGFVPPTNTWIIMRYMLHETYTKLSRILLQSTGTPPYSRRVRENLITTHL